MTNVEKVQKAVEYINVYKHYDFVLVSIKDWYATGDGVEIKLNVGYKVQEFGFTGTGFKVDEDPLGIDGQADIEHIKDEDKRITLRIAYYLLDGYMKTYGKK